MGLVFCLTSLAEAQATRTWVSGVGDDANPCSRTAPCKTFAGAISKTATNGYIDEVPKERVADYERDLYRFMDSVGKNVTAKIAKDKAWSADIEKEVRAMLDEFKKTNTYTEDKPAAASPDDKKPQAPAKPEAKKPEAPAKPAAKPEATKA